ncbi:hypothetical protein Ctob_003514 [Chrysochromulina tobinii]|uniref:Uncharacterized protein n=1 Tax=Chrysochromulina tobinii TaxID=1460289 RepID=A0A0M0J8Q0_9EUKA|nr:hypothetical protein Ctob_003514 [Chrysochromulina tobinii]|eukprot:KOO22941.1 hypothetical protein Ctob_003514 [Chrysochromulina sp. CCMP291]
MADSPAAPANPAVAEKTPSSPNVVAEMFSALGNFSNNVTKSAAATADTLTKGAVASKDDMFSALGNFSNNVTKSAANTADMFAKGAVATKGSLTKSVAAVAEATVSTAAAAAKVVTDRDKAVPVSDDEVNAPTPVERWFMVAEGWTCDPVQHAGESKATPPPPPLMPHDYTALASIEALGMLELEVLEAKDLPSKLFSGVSGVGGDLLGRTVSAVGGVGGANVKAAVDGGASLIKTTTAKARDVGAEVGSAFRDEVGRDSVGRVTLPLSALVSGVQYDAWFALAFNRHTDQPGQHGFVRLRYTLRVTSSRTRMLSYASAPPPHLLPFTKEYYRYLSLFATGDVCRATKGLFTLASVFMPWPALVHYGLRAAGLLVCGPHMILVGRWVDDGRRAERMAERAYRQADANDRAAILADYEKQLIDEARVRLVRARAANARRPPHALAQSQFLEAHPELELLRLQDWRSGAHLSEDTLAEPVCFTARVAPPPVAPGGGTPPAGGRGSDGAWPCED